MRDCQLIKGLSFFASYLNSKKPEIQITKISQNESVGAQTDERTHEVLKEDNHQRNV